ncbi:hypothetical protein FSARC_14860 [Fusarium sarcochroum]|uniref:Short chain oxidoreductase n=1 Tax=Fusarium sarcochroum TaxID=1208366 RepID=A0A8H4WN24_9HYPO|nr:hypothetical protein FSARC_14860 [Fusarium sarcochroum]
MASYFISGASRGIGLGMVTALAAKPASQVSIIFAAARTQSDEIKKLAGDNPGRIELVPLEVTSDDSIKSAVRLVERSLGDKGLDVLLNVAGVTAFAKDGLEYVDNFTSIFETNVTGVHNVTRALLPLLRKGNQKKIINFTSTIGSIAWAPQYMVTPTPAYKVSKAALNMLTVQYAHSFSKEGFTIIGLSPGWLKTNLGGSTADLDLETGVNASLDVIFNVKRKDNGKALNVKVPGFENSPMPDHYEGGQFPW